MTCSRDRALDDPDPGGQDLEVKDPGDLEVRISRSRIPGCWPMARIPPIHEVVNPCH